jgi:hypothetical protein
MISKLLYFEQFVFWDVTPCSRLKFKGRFGRKFSLHLKDRTLSQARDEHEEGCNLLHAAFLIGFFGDTEDGDVPLKRPLNSNVLHGVVSVKDKTLHNHSCENLICYILYFIFSIEWETVLPCFKIFFREVPYPKHAVSSEMF